MVEANFARPVDKKSKADLEKRRQQRFGAAFLASAFLHVVPVAGIEAADMLKEHRIKKREGETKELVHKVEEALEQGERIDDLGEFFIEAEFVEMGFTKREREKARQILNERIQKAQEMKDDGASYQEVIDYIVSVKGEYRSGQNSLIKLLTTENGSCKARFKHAAAILSVVYPEEYANDQIQVQTFNGDPDNDGVADNTGHYRVVMKIDEKNQIVAEGAEGSFVEPIPDPEQGLVPTQMEVNDIVVKAYLADDGLYQFSGIVQGPKKPLKLEHDSILSMPGSPVGYSSTPPDFQAKPVYSTDWEPQVEYLVPTTLTLATYLDKNIPDVQIFNEYNEIDISILKHIIQTKEKAKQAGKPEPLGRQIEFKFDRFNNINETDDPEVMELISKFQYVHLKEIINPEQARIISSGETWSLTLNSLDSPEIAKILANGNIETISINDDISNEVLHALGQGNRISIDINNKYGTEVPTEGLDGNIWTMKIQHVSSPETIKNLENSNVRMVTIWHLEGVDTAQAVIEAYRRFESNNREETLYFDKILWAEPKEAYDLIKAEGVSSFEYWTAYMDPEEKIEFGFAERDPATVLDIEKFNAPDFDPANLDEYAVITPELLEHVLRHGSVGSNKEGKVISSLSNFKNIKKITDPKIAKLIANYDEWASIATSVEDIEIARILAQGERNTLWLRGGTPSPEVLHELSHGNLVALRIENNFPLFLGNSLKDSNLDSIYIEKATSFFIRDLDETGIKDVGIGIVEDIESVYAILDAENVKVLKDPPDPIIYELVRRAGKFRSNIKRPEMELSPEQEEQVKKILAGDRSAINSGQDTGNGQWAVPDI